VNGTIRLVTFRCASLWIQHLSFRLEIRANRKTGKRSNSGISADIHEMDNHKELQNNPADRFRGTADSRLVSPAYVITPAVFNAFRDR
jgi:hypothetical protein